MRSIGREPWQVWSNVLKALGGVGCLAVLLWSFGLIGYYSIKRPSEPVRENGWTVPLQWTHVSYGTPEENGQLLRLHFGSSRSLPYSLLEPQLRSSMKKTRRGESSYIKTYIETLF